MESHKLSVPYIAWEIQATCNMGCPFCYSSSWNQFQRKEMREKLPLQKILDGLEILRDMNLGIEVINWSGGEPLLRHEDLSIVFHRSRALGFRNVLSTNCMFSAVPGLGDRQNRALSNETFDQFIRTKIEPWLDWMAVSLDSADINVNNNVMRLMPDGRQGSPAHFDDVRSLIDLYRANRYRFQLKINTIVTSKNIDSGVEDIGELLVDLPCVWKLVQFNPRECPPQNRRDFEISTDEFLRRLRSCQLRYEGKPGFERLFITKRIYDGRHEPYCFFVINATGDILLPYGEDHLKLGSLYATVPALALRELIVAAVEQQLRDSDTYLKCSVNGTLSPTEVFRNLNRAILRDSYPAPRHESI